MTISNIDIYGFITSNALDVLERAVRLRPVIEKEEVSQIRLEEDVFLLTADLDRITQSVTAHVLEQYRNPLYTIKCTENVDCWLSALMFPEER